MTERRFNEAEVAAIFERAAEAQQPGGRQLPSGTGMSLTELQEIGREVGLSPDSIVQAAREIDGSGRLAPSTFLGIPLGVGLTIDLERKLTDDEWDQFVVDLRETFQARGTVRQEGSLRQWTNGNLQALLEPTARGQRIRLRTVKGDARATMVMGLSMFAASAVGLLAAVVRGTTIDVGMMLALGLLATMGLTMFGMRAMLLPAWARIRQRQMEEVAARLALVAARPTTPLEATTAPSSPAP
jgi:hypothetical protein